MACSFGGQDLGVQAQGASRGRLQSSCWPGLWLSEDLTEAAGSTAKVTHMAASARPQFLATWTSL
jgi:hypothetical protein